ncbi:hypothetical protein JW916_11955 [Candidatus Sumerlaeota bacterium]|nr:hypothetical protein [Candidatus Sumerlaeota bacterium]
MQRLLSQLVRSTDVRVLNAKLERIPGKARHPGEMLMVDLYIPRGTAGYIAEGEECWIEFNADRQTYVLHGSVFCVDDRMRRARVRIDPDSLKEAEAQSGRKEIRYPCSVAGSVTVAPPHAQAGVELRGKVDDISKRGVGIVIPEEIMPAVPEGAASDETARAIFWHGALDESATVWLSMDLPDLASPGADSFSVKIRSAVRSCQLLSRFGENDFLRLSVEYDLHRETYPNPDHVSRIRAFADFLKRYVWSPQ